MNGPTGLTGVPTETLVQLLRLLYRGTLPCPMHSSTLAPLGFQAFTEDLGALRGLDEGAVRAVLVCVLAERRAVERAAAGGPSGVTPRSSP